MGVLAQRVALLAFGALFVLVERLFPERKAPLLRPGLGTDVLHLLFTEFLSNAVIIAGVAVLWFPLQALKWNHSADVIASWPVAMRIIVALVMLDFVGYWSHRLQHTVPALWDFHRVHHSSPALDFFAGVRRHPIDEAIGRWCLFVPLIWFGFGLEVLAPVSGLVGVWAGLLHANVRWRFSWVRRFLGTPDFHHWHHATLGSTPGTSIGCNFATFFTHWDRLFGTHHLPDERPTHYGTNEPVSAGYVGQVLEPMKASRARWKRWRAGLRA